ncbi:MAG: S1 RNA-binding domain-containing protein, partial [Spirochaetota bacterium]
VQGGVEGLINKSQLADPREMPFEKALEKYNVGDKIRAVVTEINPGRQKLSLSIRELARQEQRQEMQKYVGDDDGSTFTLGDILKDKENEE